METATGDSQCPTHSALNYRPEIDGLRAVAVIVVVLFHAKLGCTGGYSGVDVFFVISGYLITSLIFREIEASNFRLIEFWERRIRRIVPALIVTVVATLVGAWFLFLPDDFDRVAHATIAQTVFGSNIYHWRVSGYYGPLAESLPLLHTWSLAVEEQFYILLPVALLVVGFGRRAWLAPSIALAFAGSFSLAVWATPKYEAASFYLLPTRAWELLLGSLLGAHPVLGNAAPRWAREAISLGGLGAIVISVTLFDSGTPFPGVPTLLPCLGTAAFLWANRLDFTIGGRILAWRPVVFIGQVSYSFYLFHWPVLVFSLYWFGHEMPWGWRLGLVNAAFLLAVLSWVLVETPVRKKRVLGGRWTLFCVTVSSMLLLLAFGQFVRLHQGFPSRFDPRTLAYLATRDDGGPFVDLDLQAAESGCLTKIGTREGIVRFLVYGDSHARALIPALDYWCRENGICGVGATRSSNAPLLNFVYRGKYSSKEDATSFNEAIVRFAIKQRVQTVVMVGFWSTYAADPRFEQCLRDTVNTLTSAGLKVVIVRDVPEQSGDVPRLLARSSLLGQDVRRVGVSLEVHREKNRKADEFFSRLAGSDIVIIDPSLYFVDRTGLCRAEYDGKAMYRDSHHLSFDGALRLRPLFEQICQEQPQE